MNYTKPEVAVLGDARTMIESILSKTQSVNDGLPRPNSNPAYDLDE